MNINRGRAAAVLTPGAAACPGNAIMATTWYVQREKQRRKMVHVPRAFLKARGKKKVCEGSFSHKTYGNNCFLEYVMSQGTEQTRQFDR